jgi:hypothetical protein
VLKDWLIKVPKQHQHYIAGRRHNLELLRPG